jgi:hypothetical protein
MFLSLLFKMNYCILGTTINSERLLLGKLRSNKIVMTCIADNGVDEVLKKEITVLVSGKISKEIKRSKAIKLILIQNVALQCL